MHAKERTEAPLFEVMTTKDNNARVYLVIDKETQEIAGYFALKAGYVAIHAVEQEAVTNRLLLYFETSCLQFLQYCQNVVPGSLGRCYTQLLIS